MARRRDRHRGLRRVRLPRRVQPSPAPGELELLRRFLNTVVGSDEFASADRLESWLEAHKLRPEGLDLTTGDWRRMVAVRDGLRAVLTAPGGGRPDAGVVSDLQQALGRLPFELVLDAAGRPVFEPAARGLDGVIAVLVGIAARSLDRWPRLKVCSACDRVYYDPSKRGDLKWCSDRCGDRLRARKYRAAKKARRARG